MTQRETEALDLILAGLSNKEIADRLGVSVNTATAHTKAILRRFRVPSRVALLVLLLGDAGDRPSRREAPIPLTPRQRETLQLMVAGLPARQIAERLGISVHAVNEHTREIFRRFGVGSRAALLARVLGLCRPVPPALVG